MTFDASGSTDADGTISSYEWELGDGTTTTGQSITHTYGSAGEYTVTLTVTDDAGATGSDTTTVVVRTDGGGGTTSNRIVAYWMQWAQYDRGYVPADIPFEDITHLQYAFMRPEQDGSISGVGDSYGQRYLFPESWHDVTTIADLNEQHPDVTFLISIGGWNDSENFSDAALTESSRQTFADECVRIIRDGGVDGVDIDWEYPGGGGHPDNTVRDGDQERFTLLLQAVRDALDVAGQEDGTEYHLSTAMSADPETASGLEHGTLSSLLDFTSIMTFDYRGGFSDYTGHQSPLYENPADPASNSAEWNVSSALQWYVDQGWDPGQLNMAMPFYGRSFAGVEAPSGDVGNGVDDGLFQNFSGTGSGSFPPDTQESGIYDYWDIATSGGERSGGQVDLSQPGWETTYDDTAVSAWSYNQDESLVISHETPQTVEEKMAWLSNSDYGGTMLWALSHDTVDHTLLTRLSDTLL
ncbi:glycosyl hydrolase family 18 protein [Halocatena salina]|uniref:Glycosyl hydrolase family 18 protein n=1 Tax=Halocatena salina TaxID=2934340 RepID=A0A8U0A4I7_9EURY|nr:glycosyl hydrolase family 18 protein [Halocatena salina]